MEQTITARQELLDASIRIQDALGCVRRAVEALEWENDQEAKVGQLRLTIGLLEGQLGIVKAIRGWLKTD